MTFANPSVVFTGQMPIVVTGTVVPFPKTTNTLLNGVIITAPSTNTGTIYVGGSTVQNQGGGTGNGYPLVPGQSTSVGIQFLNALFINGTAGDFISYIGN